MRREGDPAAVGRVGEIDLWHTCGLNIKLDRLNINLERLKIELTTASAAALMPGTGDPVAACLFSVFSKSKSKE